MAETLRILVAEDDKITQAFYEECLSEVDLYVRITGSGKEALNVYREWKPDIVVLDITLHEMSGYSVLKEIRETGDKSTTIIMGSSMSRKSDIIDCFKLGIQGYMTKPFDSTTLRDKILQFHQANRVGS